MALLKAEFDCEVLTPMFLSGVDQNTCELRAASLRGVLRYWYRALLGGQGVTDLRELKRREAAVFGSTDAASPISVRVFSTEDLRSRTRPPSSLPQWDQRRNTLRQNTGIGYLWFSITLGDNFRPYIEPGTPFRVVLSTRVTATNTEQQKGALRDAIRAFWLLQHLGGVGTRARRGAGAFWVRGFQDAAGVELPPFPKAFDSTAFRNTLADWGLQRPKARPPFAALAPGYCRIVREPVNAADWSRAIQEVGEDFKAYRSDHSRAADAARASFGLPLTLGRGASTRDIRLTNSERRGSPLHIRVVPERGGGYDAVYTHFDSAFTGQGQSLLVDHGRGQTHAVPPAVPGLLPDFLDTVPESVLLFS